jgi:hypothetical protein
MSRALRFFAPLGAKQVPLLTELRADDKGRVL